LDDLRRLAQGGTAAGSGLNAPEGFAEWFCEALNALVGGCFEPHPVKVDGMAAHDALAALSADLKGLASTLARIANDIRHLASGPRAGLGELVLADDGLSSSIMPGKRNATQAEAMLQIAYRVTGNDATVAAANASSLFELNVAKPVIILALLESVELLSAAIPPFAAFIEGVEPDVARMADNVEMSLMLATALTPEIGYDGVAEVTRMADSAGLSLREAVQRSGLISAERYDDLIDPARMADAGRAKRQ
jgi:fumarate hydratase class II